MKTENKSKNLNWKDDPNRVRRAERLLLKAEQEDQRIAKWEAKKLDIAEVKAQRNAVKQAQADEWNALFDRLNLPLKAKVQTVEWVNFYPEPETYVYPTEREKSWAILVEYLKR